MRTRRYLPSVAETHRRWLELVDTAGPFLAVPPLKEVWPQGVPPLSPDSKAILAEAKPAFEKAWETWDRDGDDAAALAPYRTARDAWVTTILTDVVGWGGLFTTDLAGTPTDITATSLDRTVSVTPTGALVHSGTVYALVLTVDPVDSLRDQLEDGWAASPIDRMEALLRAASVPIGVVTDGRWWALVCTQDGAMTASGVVDSQTWIEEPDVRDAFVALLGRQRLIGGRPEHRLPALFTASVAAAEEITEALGVQVRRAVELLVSAFSETAEDARRRGEPDPLPADRDLVYQAAVTVMMRVVFLLFAEERSLLPQGELFTMGYGITGQLDELDDRKRLEGAESLDATHLTWHRLLATSNALYAGATFEDIRLPAYGGSLFDPDRFAFLLARREQGTLRVTVSDRVMLEVLRSVQEAQLRGQPARRISFRDVDVEQIGYIYEGLLGYSCTDVNEIHVGLIGAEGAEPEIPLNKLADIAEINVTDARIADAILKWVKDHQPGAKPRTKAALTKALASSETVEDADLALLAVTRDPALRKELRTWIGIIRRDLRGRPVVIQPGGLMVVETPSRATAGAHYTPRSLAEHIVEHALEPLVYRPGPHQTADRSQWRLLSSDDLLDLNVADIACGSGAFLVAAARYLADRLVEAWHAEHVAIGTPHELHTRAIRRVVATCLYGADINEMAVEMAKLSLWLVSLDPKLPFSFVDDKILHGNSLLGLTSARQLEAMHIDPTRAPRATSLFDLDVEDVLHRAVRLRERLATEIDNDDPQRSATAKRRQWAEYQALTNQLRTIADGIIAAGLKLGGKPGRTLDDAYHRLRMAVADAYPTHGGDPKPERLHQIIDEGLTPTVPTDYDKWKPLHWILAVPDVMQNGGFDAIIGNPPFLGGKKISTANGENVREWYVHALAEGTKGNADLVAYFFLRASRLLVRSGTLGLIATNTIAQGDTREVGLDRMVERGFTITRAIQSRSWPSSSASLEYAAVWGKNGAVSRQLQFVSDDMFVRRISTLLEPEGRTEGHPVRLRENAGLAFIGSYVLGMGFVINSQEATDWIAADPRNADVLSPYLNGEDLNSRPDSSASRWVIDFGERPEAEARTFEMPWERVQQRVKPDRIRKDGKKYPRMVFEWWKFFNSRPAMRGAIAPLDQVLVLSRVGDAGLPLRVGTRQVLNERLVVFASDDFALQATLSSSVHLMWTVKYSSTLETRLVYGPSAAFETFPRPAPDERLARSGRTLDAERREIMLRRELGLTKLYNLVNDPEIQGDPDVDLMREIHVDLDEAVMDAYGWSDIPLNHGFHTYRQMRRWTVCPEARVEILDRLLEENHRRAALQGDVVPGAHDDEDVEDE